MFHVEQNKTHIEVVDHFLTKEKFKIQKTSVPGLLQTIPTPAKEDMIKYYKSERYISHNSNKLILKPDQSVVILKNLSNKKDRIKLVKEELTIISNLAD